jgi:hypothetical protein
VPAAFPALAAQSRLSRSSPKSSKRGVTPVIRTGQTIENPVTGEQLSLALGAPVGRAVGYGATHEPTGEPEAATA